MDLPIILVFIIIGVSILLFITELFPVDKISFFIIVALVLLQLTTPEEAISGFANPATITILALMILAVGLEENGVIQLLSDGIKKLRILPLILITPAFMIISASISAFISTTAVVIICKSIIGKIRILNIAFINAYIICWYIRRKLHVNGYIDESTC